MDLLDLENLQKYLKEQLEVVAAYFYGSRVSGYHKEKSDLDLAIVVDEVTKVDYLQLYPVVSKVFPDFEVDLRIVDQDSQPSFLFEVLKNGKCIYKRNEPDRVRFETKAMIDFYDSAHIRDIYDHYLTKYFQGER